MVKIQTAFYWTARLILLLFLTSIIIYAGIGLTIILIRVIPYLAPYMRTNSDAITNATGGQFISTFYPASAQSGNIIQRLRVDPLTPVAIGVSLLRKIKPLDNLLKKIIPPLNNTSNTNTNPITGS